LSAADGKAVYRVRLGFAAPAGDKPGQRVFDIKLQGNVVEENVDIVKQAGGPRRALFKEFDGVEVTDKLAVELVAKTPKPGPEQLPILQAAEITRQRVLGLGCVSPDFLLSSMIPKQTGEVQVANLRDAPFEGTFQLVAPKGFSVSPKQMPVKMAAGTRTTIPIEASVLGKVPPGNYQIALKLARPDGSVELERTSKIEHLGQRGRIVVPAVEDAFVSHRYPDRNQGTGTVLLVDGGHQEMGDASHNLAYLKFRLDVPGKPIKVHLRIRNAGNPSGDSGRVCLVTEPWSETKVTYNNRPKPGKELAKLGAVRENQEVECPLKIDLAGKKELSLIIDPTSCDGIDYLTRESKAPAQLVIEYEPKE